MDGNRTSHSNVNEIATFLKEVARFIDTSSIRTILELGSRDAEVSIALKRAFPKAQVFAFECNPPAIELCRLNIAASGLGDITLIPKAVSDTNGTVDFYAIDPVRTVTPHADGNIGASSMFKANPEYPDEQYHQERIEVETTTIAQWANEKGISDVDLVWMDLQGAELKALQGMGELLNRVRILYTEVEFKPLYIDQPLFQEIDQFVRKHGFRLHRKFDRSDWFGDAMYVNSDIRSNILAKVLRMLTRFRVPHE